MKLTKEQKQEILDQQSQKNYTKRVTSPELEKVLYYEAFVVTSSATEGMEGGLEVGRVISEQQYFDLKEQGVEFEAGMGGEVVKKLLQNFSYII